MPAGSASRPGLIQATSMPIAWAPTTSMSARSPTKSVRRGIGARPPERCVEDVRTRLAPADLVGDHDGGEQLADAAGLEDGQGGGAVVEVRHDGEPMAARQPLEQRPVVGREERGLGQLIAVGVDQRHVEAGRQPRGIERQALEEIGEALAGRHLAMVDRPQALGLLPRGGQRAVAALEA